MNEYTLDYVERCQLDHYCKLVLYHETIDYLREMQRYRNRQTSLGDISPAQWDKLSTLDEYPSDSFVFSAFGYDLHIRDELVAGAFTTLPEQEQQILILRFVAAMADGTGLSRFRRMFPDRFFDVGIAEEHAVTFAAGLAAGGMKPVFAVYSSFLQRGYDQLIHDVGLQNLPVVLAVDRAGLVGSDGETHQGIFDLSYLGSIPNMTILSPKNRWELADMLRFALAFEGPVALRYPRGTAYDGYREFRAPVVYGKSEMIREEKDIALVSVGHMFETAAAVRDMLKEKGYSCTLVNARFVKPLDEEMFVELSRTHDLIGVIEENVPCGSFGERVLAFACKRGLKARILPLSLPDDYVEHGSVEILRRETGLDPESLTKRILEAYKEL